VEGAQTGFGLSGGTADITGSSFSGNFRGIAIEGAGATVSDTASSENTQAGIYARTASLSIQSALFSGDYVSLNLGATNALVENSTFLAATIGDLVLDAASVATLRASPQEGMVKFVDAASRLSVEALLTVTVADRYGAMQSGALVHVEDNGNGTAAMSVTTDREGRTAPLVLVQRHANQAGAVDFNPFAVSASVHGAQQSESVAVHGAMVLAVTLPSDVTPPIPRAAGLLAVDEDLPLQLDASASSDNDPTFASTGVFNWSFPELGVVLYGVQAIYTFSLPGEYQGVLTATDAAGNAATITFVVQVRDTKPPVIGNVQVPDRGVVGQALAFDASATDDDATFTAANGLVWRFSLGADAFVRTGPHVDMTFDRPGAWTVTLTATDPTGNSVSVERTIAIDAPPTPSPWPWIGGGLALLAAALGLATERGKVGLFTLFLPLYTRIKDDAVLDQFTRGQIYGYIRVHPGDTYTDIRRNLDLNNGTLTYHLDVLEREGLVRSRAQGSRKTFYPVDVRPPEDGGGLHEIQQRLLRVLHEAPGTGVSDLAGVLGISRQLAIYHLRFLAQQGFVRLERRGVRLCAFALGPKV
ncbi:MAG TPA: PKD domain-containing protein, partial [Thermoplasmata archaeon]|nr:PKD domain-containing protein [Thermoplasmata archaeon]